MPENPISGLYPQPPQPAAPISPLQVIQAIPILNQNALFQKEFAAKQAVGNAFQAGLNPDGTIDPNKISAGLHNPAAAFGAPEAVGTLLQQRGAQIANSTAQFGLLAGQNQAVLNAIGPVSQNPAASKEDVLGLAPKLARLGVPPDLINGWVQGVVTDPKGVQHGLATTNNIALGPAGAAGRVPGPVTSEGAPTTITTGQAGFAGAGGAGSQPGIATALPPGQPEAIAANQAQFQADQQNATAALAGIRPLQQALPLIDKLKAGDFGPTSEGFAQIKGTLESLGVIPQNATDLEVRQELNKKLLSYAGQTRTADRSDKALSQALQSNPHLDLTQGANLALIKNQIGLDRMDAAAPIAFNTQNPTLGAKAGYGAWKASYYQSNDPRAFSFDLMTPAERREVIDSLGKPDSPAYQKFAKSYALAKQTGIITPTQAPNGQ